MAVPAEAELTSALTGRSFALLDQPERERIGRLLRPLAWLDGLITATVIAPQTAAPLDDPDNDDAVAWLDMIWNDEHEAEIVKLTFEQYAAIVDPVMAHYAHVAESMWNDPEAYRPYLAGVGPVTGQEPQLASQWAAGFSVGFGIDADAWAPLFEDRDALPLIIAIMSLVPEEEIPEELRAQSPFRGMPEEQRQRIRQTAIGMLPDIVQSLRDTAFASQEIDDQGPA